METTLEITNKLEIDIFKSILQIGNFEVKKRTCDKNFIIEYIKIGALLCVLIYKELKIIKIVF